MSRFKNVLILLFCSTFSASAQTEELKLWFREPAANWNEALPVGNGRLGAMVFGGVENERLQLNEETVWSKGGFPEDKEDGYKEISGIRKLLFEGKYVEAEKMCMEHLMLERMPSGFSTYQTLGDLNLAFEGLKSPSAYKRELLLDSALVRTSFDAGGVKHSRTVFSSAADQVLVMLAEADREAQISCSLELSRPGDFEKVYVEYGLIKMTGRAGEDGVSFEARLMVTPYGGAMRTEGTRLIVEGADKLELRLVAGGDYWGADPSGLCDDYQVRVRVKPFAEILADHVADYQDLFDRVHLELPTSEAAGFATDDRIDAQKRGIYDPSLAALYFQFGRYLLISSSRPGCLPANLQGIWCDGLTPGMLTII